VTFKKAIVVGASSGIGAAIVERLAASGASVAAVARRSDRIEALAAKSGGRVLPYSFDTTKVDEVPELFERIVRELRGVDTLVYAAGVMPRVAESEYAFAKDRAMVEVNFLGAMAWMNVAAAKFEATRAGTIIGISSIAGERGRRKFPAYSASKAGLTAYLEALRNRCSRYGVNVVTVKPGYVDTEMTQGNAGMFWVISADEAAKQTLKLAEAGTSASGFVPPRWTPIVFIVRNLPSFIFRRLNF
jgi:short-subunit dehydrogenase